MREHECFVGEDRIFEHALWPRDLQRGIDAIASFRSFVPAATEIDYPLVSDNPPEELTAASPPRTIRDLERAEVRDLTLAEAIHIALQAMWKLAQADQEK